MKGKNKGFTLIELLVVIAIIGILSSVVLASLNSARQKGRDAKRVSDLGQMRVAFELYFDSNRAYPAASSSLVTGGYMPALPVPPVSGEQYLYSAAASNATSYVLRAALEDANHVTLVGDIDGTSNGTANTDCSDTPIAYYCVRP
ncbi:MAG: type II secretion system protein [Patescibacteria group bacterium]